MIPSVCFATCWRTRRKAGQSATPLVAEGLALLGENLLLQRKYTEAEPLLRESAGIHEKLMPEEPERYRVMSLLGEALLRQGRHAPAEPLVIAGYEGLKARESRIAAPDRTCVLDAAERVVRVYEQGGKPEQAAAWKAKLGLRDLPAEVFALPR